MLDDKNVRRRFRASNYQSTTRVKPFICTMPMRLDEGWNQIQFNLSDFTRRAYGTNYIETLRVQIHASELGGGRAAGARPPTGRSALAKVDLSCDYFEYTLSTLTILSIL